VNLPGSPDSAYRIIGILAGAGIFWSTLRHIVTRHYGPDAIYPWRLGDQRPTGWWERVAARLLEYPGLSLILLLRSLAGLWTSASSLIDTPAAPAVTLLLLTSLIKAWRLRLINEDAEVMNLTVLFPLAFHTWQRNDSILAAAGLWFICVQLCIAYLSSGLSKLNSSAWKKGVALTHIYDGSLLRNPAMARSLNDRPRLAQLLCWSTMALEILFPIALFAPPPFMLMFLAAGAVFHLGVAITFGLGSFMWAFLAAYPAVAFVNGSISAALRRL
jgi:hypothetical protein